MSEKKYAIIKTGGKQYRVSENDIIDVELLDSQNSDQIQFSEVLFLNDLSGARIGKPTVPGVVVRGTILGEVAGEKVTSVKYKRSHNVRRKFGHRQHYSRVKITAIGA